MKIIPSEKGEKLWGEKTEPHCVLPSLRFARFTLPRKNGTTRSLQKILHTRNTYLAITPAKVSLVTALKLSPVGRGPGGALGYFLGGYVPPGTPNWHPVLKKNSPKIDTPF